MTVRFLLPRDTCQANGGSNGQPSQALPVSVDDGDIEVMVPAGFSTTSADGTFQLQTVVFKQKAIATITQQVINAAAGVSCPGLLPSIVLSQQTPLIPSPTVVSSTTSGVPVAGSTPSAPTNGSTAPRPSDTGASSSGAKSPSKGAIAGAAVGGLLGGILIGAAVLFLLGFRRRRASKTARGHTESAYGYADAKNGYPDGKNAATASPSMSIPMDSAAAIVERNLPDPISDNDIISEFSKVDDKINGHVNSFYTQNHTTDHLAAAQAIAPILGAGSSLTLQKINALLANPQTRSTVLRAMIAKTLVSRMDPDGSSAHALLPFGTAATIRGMPKVQTNDKTRMAFMTKWRAITAYLVGIPSNTNTVSEESIHQTVQDCDNLIGAYATPTPDQQVRLQNLEGICHRAGRVAGMLFSQQSTFRFDWSHSGPGLVVFPGLVKINDEMGWTLQQPMVFAEKKVVQI